MLSYANQGVGRLNHYRRTINSMGKTGALVIYYWVQLIKHRTQNSRGKSVD